MAKSVPDLPSADVIVACLCFFARAALDPTGLRGVLFDIIHRRNDRSYSTRARFAAYRYAQECYQNLHKMAHFGPPADNFYLFLTVKKSKKKTATMRECSTKRKREGHQQASSSTRQKCRSTFEKIAQTTLKQGLLLSLYTYVVSLGH